MNMHAQERSASQSIIRLFDASSHNHFGDFLSFSFNSGVDFFVDDIKWMACEMPDTLHACPGISQQRKEGYGKHIQIHIMQLRLLFFFWLS